MELGPERDGLVPGVEHNTAKEAVFGCILEVSKPLEVIAIDTCTGLHFDSNKLSSRIFEEYVNLLATKGAV